MPRYIDADVILTKFDKTLQLAGNDGAIAALKFCKEIVRKAPTISPDEVRGVGRWVRINVMSDEWFKLKCSCCQKEFEIMEGELEDYILNYCPNCGAKMEVSEDA